MKLTASIVYNLYAEYLRGLRRNEGSVKSKRRAINVFFESISKDDLRDVSRKDILNFAKYLDIYVRRDGRADNDGKLSKRTKQDLMREIKLVFNYLYVSGYLLSNVFEKLDNFDFRGVVSIRKVFSKDDITRFLECIDTNSFYGLRTRVMFELMYSSGLRISEAVNLDTTDLDLESREVLIRCSKFNKDRIVPISEVAEKFLRKYLDKTERVRGKKDAVKPLFFKESGERLKPAGVRLYFRRYIKKCGLDKKGYAVHSIRHATATHLLESGADIRYVQELLGHEQLDTTAKYTHMMLDNLKKIYKSHHPRENEYYKEVDSEYLSKVRFLKERLLVEREKNTRWKRNMRRKNLNQ